MENLFDVLLQHGYIVIFIGMLIDASGIPFPGDIFLLIAGYLSYRGDFHIALVIPIAAVAVTLGDSVTFNLGKLWCVKGGEKVYSLLCKWSKCTLASKKCFEDSCNSLKKLGTRSVLWGKFMWGMREFVPVLSGMSGMHYKVFIKWDVLSVLLWVSVFTLAGFFFGSNIDGLVNMFENVTSAMATFGLVAAAVLVVIKYSQKIRHGVAPIGEELSKKSLEQVK